MRQGVVDFAARALADVSADVDDEDFVGHVDLALVHVVQHLLGALGPDFVVARVPEKPDAYDDIPLEGEARAAAEGYDGVFVGHGELYNDSQELSDYTKTIRFCLV